MSQATGDRRRRPERRGSGRVQHDVMQLILDRGLGPGAPLPTETELMADLGVSRNSVREALKALQALDIVDIRHGYGTYVGQASLDPLADGLTFRTLARSDDTGTGALAEILQVREVLEEGLIRRVAAVSTEAELDLLAAVVDRMEAAGRAGEPLPELDREFHELLYAPLGNAFVPQLLGAFWTVFSRVAGARGWTDDPAELTVRRHRAIVTALRARDVTAAQRAMTDHFRGIESRATRKPDEAG